MTYLTGMNQNPTQRQAFRITIITIQEQQYSSDGLDC